MEYSAESVRYLHVAYAIFLAVQVGYAAWLAYRWNQVKPAGTDRYDSTRANG